MTTRTVRDKFARLSQMATLLTLESVGRLPAGLPRHAARPACVTQCRQDAFALLVCHRLLWLDLH